MRNQRTVCLGILTVSAAVTFVGVRTLSDRSTRAFGAEPPGPAITWRPDYEAARQEAQASGKPLLVVFR